MDISIISINYNNSHLTEDFIKSVIKYTPESLTYEIIIVDNCSEIQDYRNLENLIKDINSDQVILKRSNINLGFGGGNMFGNQFATGHYLAFINNDVVFTQDCFGSLIQFLKKKPECGVVTPQQYNGKNEPTTGFDHFHGLRKEFFGRSLIEKTSNKAKRKAIPYQQNIKVDFVQGCFMFFTAKAFQSIGGFDTNLFLYYEEMDTCFRLKQLNFESWLCPETSFMHLHGASTNSNYAIKKELIISRLYILRKNHNYIKYSIIKLWYVIKYAFKSILKRDYFPFFTMILSGKYLENSLKHQQKIVVIND
jgi:GT2 family glycosyltransferase